MERRISELPEQEFDGTLVNNCFYVEFEDQERFLGPIKRIKLNSVLEWIKEQSKEIGLTVKLIKDNENEQIVFIKRKDDKDLNNLSINRLIQLARKGKDYESIKDKLTEVEKENIKLKILITETLSKDLSSEYHKKQTFEKLEVDLKRALTSDIVQHHDMIEAMLVFVDEIKNIKKHVKAK